MSVNKSRLKTIKTDAKKRLANRAKKSILTTTEKKLMASIEAGNKEEAQTNLVACYSKLDKAAKSGLIKKNKADRKKSRLTCKVNAL